MSSRICYLLNKETQKKVFLLHKQPKIVGRNPETEVQDLYVSKKQLECTADTEKCLVTVKCLGTAISGINGYATVKNRSYQLGHGHLVELRLGHHEYEIVFDPPPKEKSEETKKFPIFNKKNGSEKKESFDIKKFLWEFVDNKELLICSPDNLTHQRKIASFDMDGTIIKTKSGKRFPINKDDWELNFPVIPSILKKLVLDNYKIIFFTNQSGVGKDSVKIEDFKYKVENVLKALAVPVQVFVALGKTFYRKPMPGMWNTLIDVKNGDVLVDKQNSFYVGDAAGRADAWAPKKKKDHSVADRLFALNIGLKFYTPEEYFLNAKPAPFVMPLFDPRTIPVASFPNVDYGTPNVIVMVGAPGSGKSHFCRKVLVPKGYEYVNRDEMGTWQKCVKSLESALVQKGNCVIDNTNTDKESRSKYINICKKYNVDCFCFVMNTSTLHCKHNNRFRELTDKSHIPVSEIIINSMIKNFQEPELNEGFKEIVRVPFVVQFDDKEKEKLYKLFLLEK